MSHAIIKKIKLYISILYTGISLQKLKNTRGITNQTKNAITTT